MTSLWAPHSCETLQAARVTTQARMPCNLPPIDISSKPIEIHFTPIKEALLKVGCNN